MARETRWHGEVCRQADRRKVVGGLWPKSQETTLSIGGTLVSGIEASYLNV